jgi:DNA polymerase III subunit alpha
VQGTLQRASERFGERFKVTQVWDLESARCKFGKYLRVQVNRTNGAKPPAVEQLLKNFPAKREPTEHGEFVRGLGVRFSLVYSDFVTEDKVRLEEAKFFPSDAALASWMAQADKGLAQVVYE